MLRILGYLFGLLRMYFEHEFTDQSQQAIKTQTSQPPPVKIAPKINIDPDLYLKICKVVQRVCNMPNYSLEGLGFTKINIAILRHYSADWGYVALKTVEIIARERHRTLTEVIDTYEIWINEPWEFHDACTIWIRPRDRDYDKLPNKKKEKPKEEIIETEVIKPKTMAATNGR